jgi:thiamine-phosphate pyrophosphorylase
VTPLNPSSERPNKSGIARLHYISQADERGGHLDHIREACEAGVDWVQLRVKDQPENAVMDLAVKARRICGEFGTKLIVNDHPHIALAAEAHGVHLGQTDMEPAAARDLLGEQFVIGGTANTIEDLQRLHAADVDYVGLGPFRFTETKRKLSPVLGLEGYRRALIQAKLKGIDVPILAIGGILFDDIRELMATGLHGVAISGLITRSPRKHDLVEGIHSVLNQFHPADAALADR